MIQPEPKGSTQGYPLVSVAVLRKIHTLAGNPVKEILLKLNLPDHRSILTDSQVTLTKHGRMTNPYSSHRFIAKCFNARHSKMEVKLKAEQADWRDDTDDEPDDQELKAHYMYMTQIQEVTPNAAENFGPVFDTEPLQKLVEIILFIIDSGCSKHMTRNLKLLSNFVKKFLGYSSQLKAYRVYNKRTKLIVETIHVNFDESPHMASDYVSSDTVPQFPTTALKQSSLSPDPQSQENVPVADKTVTTSNELDFLFSLMFDELLNETTQVVSKSFAVNAVDAPDKRQQQNTTQSTTTTVAADTPPLNIQITPKTTTQAPTVTFPENINQVETQKENTQVKEDEFINIFSTPVQKRGETSSRHFDSLNMHTFYQRHLSEHRWKKDQLLEQVIRNPTQSIRTRRQLETDGEMYLEVAFRKSICYIRDLKGNDLLIALVIATKPLDADFSGTPVDQTKYRNMVGALMFLTASRPDIVHATCYCARYQARPTEKHLREDCTSMSLAEAKYVSLSACCAQVLWLITQLIDYGFHFDKIPMYCDSKAAIAILYNPVQHFCTKYIDVRYHFIKKQVENGIVELFFVGTEYQLAELFTKALAEDRFKYLVRRIGMRCLTPKELEVLANESA
uniref:Retrotransposon protein, putative, unclassified n=1 Tax=Tanacetum cinerariifolium TaxID=118510 RepID=A0A6L2KJG3_TANCI|nr:retrotransposon protein, putative, unclassified [Tanacetum cinerariifolium]